MMIPNSLYVGMFLLWNVIAIFMQLLYFFTGIKKLLHLHTPEVLAAPVLVYMCLLIVQGIGNYTMFRLLFANQPKRARETTIKVSGWTLGIVAVLLGILILNVLY